MKIIIKKDTSYYNNYYLCVSLTSKINIKNERLFGFFNFL